MIVSGLLSTDVERDDFWEGDYHCLSPHELEHRGGEGGESSLFPNGLIAPHIGLAVALCPIAVVRGRSGWVCSIDGQ